MTDEPCAFIHVDERTSVDASPRFRRLIGAGDFEGALCVAREQIRAGAQIIDVNMDDPLIDGERAMTSFLRAVACDPEIARVPVMIDSSRWSVIEAGLKCVQGRAIVNSLHFGQGDERFVELASKIRRYGAAVVVLAADEQGPAQTLERKVEICERAYDRLTQRAGFDPEDIIFDVNVTPVASGNPEEREHALASIEAIWQVKETLPGTRALANVKNVSASFGGDEPIRSAIDAVFLKHALAAGLDAVILDRQLPACGEIEADLRERIDDVILNRRPDATGRLLQIAERFARRDDQTAQ